MHPSSSPGGPSRESLKVLHLMDVCISISNRFSLYLNLSSGGKALSIVFRGAQRCSNHGLDCLAIFQVSASSAPSLSTSRNEIPFYDFLCVPFVYNALFDAPGTELKLLLFRVKGAVRARGAVGSQIQSVGFPYNTIRLRNTATKTRLRIRKSKIDYL